MSDKEIIDWIDKNGLQAASVVIARARYTAALGQHPFPLIRECFSMADLPGKGKA